MIDITLPTNCVLLAPSYLHAQIREEITKEKKGMLGLHISTLSQFLLNSIHEESPSIHMVLLQVHKRIKALLPKLVVYQQVADSEPFLRECYHFLNDIARWGIKIEELPRTSSSQQELYEILNLFHDIALPEQLQHQALLQIQTQDLTHVYILDVYHTIEEQHVYDILIANGAHIITMKPLLKQKQFFHALNKRQEIEACAQHIIAQDYLAEDIHITLCDTSYQPLLQQIFERYHIPYTLLNKQKTSMLAKRFVTLFQYVLTLDNEHLLACLDCGLFLRKGLHALREYMQVFDHDFFTPFEHVRKITESGNIIESTTLEKLKKLENDAAAVQQELAPILLSLKTPAKVTDRIAHAVSIIKDTIHSSEDIRVYQQITSILQDLYPYMEEESDLQFIISYFENITIRENPKEYEGVLIHDLTQTTRSRKYQYIMGTTQTNYPAFRTKQGIFDESYYALIHHYPSMEDRYTFYLDEMAKQLQISEELFVSYPVGTYEGKSNECALEIEQFMGIRSTPYPLQTNYVEMEHIESIDQQTAHQLFVHDGKLHGSISSLERYVKCPYSYFLRYGLALKEPMKVGFPDSYAGTLAHYVLETLTNTYGKQYAVQTKETIDDILVNELTKLQNLFPTMKDALDNVKERILVSMMQTLDTLKDFEEHSMLSPTYSEYAFDYEILLKEDITLALHGYIDRIDERHNVSCILDYKSSIKTLSEANVFAALQLQLLTYAMVIAKEHQKQLLGTYYISLKNENINCSAGSLSRRKPVTHHINDVEDYEKERRKAHRLNGWTMHTEIDVLDDDASHIVGLRMNKDGKIKAGKLYNLDTLTHYMSELYGIIANRILDGEISCKPMEDACTYCVYHQICRFHGYYEEKHALIEPDDTLYQKGEDEHA